MKLKTRSVAVASVGMALLAFGLLAWQIAKGPGASTSAKPTPTTTISTPGSTTASGVVTRVAAVSEAPAPALASSPETSAHLPPSLAPPGSRSAPAVQAPPPSATALSAPASSPPIKHRVAPSQGALQPILPNEVNAGVSKVLGRKALPRYVYLEPLARRFVATVDGLGRTPAPTDLWLFKPAPGLLKVVKSSQQPDMQLIRKANSQRYAALVQWALRTDSARLIELYARMYPLLQQTYVDLGHPNGYFNDRMIEVIDLLLATPVPKQPLRLQPVRAGKPTSTSPSTSPSTTPSTTTAPRPRFEFADPALESLATGQKILLRVGPQNAAVLKTKLKDLRSGLVKLGQSS